VTEGPVSARGRYVDRIRRGATLADLPVSLRADEVIQ